MHTAHQQTQNQQPTPMRRSLVGTNNAEVGATILGQAISAWAHPKSSSTSPIEIGVELFNETKPQNALEAMLISQMTSCHSHCLKMFSQSGNTAAGDVQMKYLRTAERLMRAYAASLEALEKHRRGGQQSVKVEHVHVNSGGQAIVGQLNTPGGK